MKKSILILTVACILFFSFSIKDWIIAPAPKELPELMNKAKWEDALRAQVNSFYKNPEIYADAKQYDTTYWKTVILVYGLLTPTNNYSTLPNYNEKGGYDNFMEKLHEVLSSEKLRKIMYKWAKPTFIQAYKKLSLENKAVYKELIELGVERINNFDYEEELAYWEKLKEEEKEYNFTWRNSKEEAVKFRKLDAFIFRRMHMDGMTKEQVKEWALQIQKDINEIDEE